MKRQQPANQFNALGQEIGYAVTDWAGCAMPSREPMVGRFCTVEPLDPERHAETLWDAIQLDESGFNWTYSPPVYPASIDDLRKQLTSFAESTDPFFHAIVDRATGDAVGWASFMRMQPEMGVIEVGYIHYTPKLQRQPAGTEAMYLMMHRAFDELGYRRYEWKCDALNAPSRAAAARYGFIYEGTFRQALVYKGRNRDTAWHAILDSEWPAIKAGFEGWLDPANFDAQGNQIRSLQTMRRELAGG